LLLNGQVLVACGRARHFLGSAELYDPASGTWTATGRLVNGRVHHTANLLPDGKVLVAGGLGGAGARNSAELYDPVSGTWTLTGSLATRRTDQTATLLPNGTVLVAGGENGSAVGSAELYDPASGTWATTASLAIARSDHTATLLLTGEILAAGGSNDGGVLASAELYDVGLEFSSAWQPQIATPILDSDQRLQLTGSLFQGISQASGGSTRDSSSNYPVVQLRSLDNSQVAFLIVDPTTGWSGTSFVSDPITDFPSGPALVILFTNGIPSAAKYLVLSETP
jgi:hypothetical protein